MSTKQVYHWHRLHFTDAIGLSAENGVRKQQDTYLNKQRAFCGFCPLNDERVAHQLLFVNLLVLASAYFPETYARNRDTTKNGRGRTMFRMVSPIGNVRGPDIPPAPTKSKKVPQSLVI
mmetsp:Transcript_10433/g.38775  ORF Transcript_10433/g.38775 Transcript_10433/m.38775 type:complete len:119 (+) Transcript_10433:12805-13161(+)